MTRSSSRPEGVAVLDVGRTDVRLLAITPHGRLLSVRSAPNEVRTGAPYPSCDTEHIWRWMMAALADLGERLALQAIVPTSYGSTAALIDTADLILPILDYAADPPPEIAAAYVEIAPWFEECYCPVNPASITLGRQLFWLSQEFPDEFQRTRWILPFAQYWAWGLAGVPACEVTSLGAQTQLWNPRECELSSWYGSRVGPTSSRRCAARGRFWDLSSSKSRRSLGCRSTSRSCAAFTRAAPISLATSRLASTTSP